MSRSSGLVVKVGFALAVVIVIGKYTDDTHAATPPATGPATPPTYANAAPAAPGGAVSSQTQSVQAQARLVFGADYDCADNIITRESGWNPHATNPGSGAYGLPQALPADKMATAGPDWRDNPATQLAWMKNYVDTRYGGACPAWQWWAAHHWY